MTWKDVWYDTLTVLIVVVFLYVVITRYEHEQPHGQDLERLRVGFWTGVVALVILRIPRELRRGTLYSVIAHSVTIASIAILITCGNPNRHPRRHSEHFPRETFNLRER
jgi:hypothetical protein